jgi:ribosomal protein S13
MSYILGTNLVSNEQVEIALTRIFGIGLKKAIQQTVKFIIKKLRKLVFLHQNSCSLPVAGKWRNTVLHTPKKSVINWT